MTTRIEEFSADDQKTIKMFLVAHHRVTENTWFWPNWLAGTTVTALSWMAPQASANLYKKNPNDLTKKIATVCHTYPRAVGLFGTLYGSMFVIAFFNKIQHRMKLDLLK